MSSSTTELDAPTNGCSASTGRHPVSRNDKSSHVLRRLPGVIETCSKSDSLSTEPQHSCQGPTSVSLSRSQKHLTGISKQDPRKATLSLHKHSRSKAALQKVLTSIFHPAISREGTRSSHGRMSSGCAGSCSESMLQHESLPSLEFVAPGVFLFSGPAPEAACSGSCNNSSSYIPSLAEDGSEAFSLIRVRTNSLSLQSVNDVDDDVLEPWVHRGVLSSIPGVMSGDLTPVEELDKMPLGSSQNDCHLRSSRLLQSLQENNVETGVAICALLTPYLDTASRKTMRATCRTWHSVLSALAPLKLPAVYHLPVEILHIVYDYLGPQDFDAARHTCCSWMRASLDETLLTKMLERGGWSSAIKDNAMAPDAGVSSEWYLSRQLSRQCALSSNWTGNGIHEPYAGAPLAEVSKIDFQDLLEVSTSLDNYSRTDLLFFASICGKFLLIAKDNTIFVYVLHNTCLRPLTKVVCPRQVLAMSMDNSSGRYAVAALLEGRLGMVCELRCHNEATAHGHCRSHTDLSEPRTTSTQMCTITGAARSPRTGPNNHHTVTSSEALQRAPDHSLLSNFDSVDVHANFDAFTLQDTNDHRMHNRNWINHTWHLHLRSTPATSVSANDLWKVASCSMNMPIEPETSTFYRHLCSDEDPPRSVSICPQRRCVAFGCSSGIELHWVDALTRQSVSRWFPLTAPSDYIYFLPPRPGVESTKKLRLISSAAHPNDRARINHQFSLSRLTVTSFWGSFGFENNGGGAGRSGCDHYHAVPLSDGYHLIFIDPSSHMLFIGCDAPLGGPTKLLRKVLLLPPSPRTVPRIYKAAAHISWGARIVVAYDKKIYFYNVPPDVLDMSRGEQEADAWETYAASLFSPSDCARDNWLNWWSENDPPDLPERSPIWPVVVRGKEIGSALNVCELAITTRPDITIWAFSSDAKCRVWQLRSGGGPGRSSRQYVCKSGIVHALHDVEESGDVVMMDANSRYDTTCNQCSAQVEQPGGFDGNASEVLIKRIPGALHVKNDEWVELLDVHEKDAWYNADGDIMIPEGRDCCSG